VLRRLWVWALICVVVGVASAVTIAIVAVKDHDQKTRRMERASVTDWACAHGGTHCGEETSAEIEDKWSRRERGYKVGFALCLAVVSGSVIVLILRRRR
jgi:hypothetical protein